MMRGLLYKEFAVNRFNLLYLFASIMTMSFLLLFVLLDDEPGGLGETEQFLGLFGAFTYLIDFYMLNMFTTNFIQADEQKNPAYFSVTTPEGVNGVVWTKYVFVLLTAVFLMIWCFFLDSVISSLSGLAVNAMMLYSILFYLHLFFSAVDLPFMFRFGAKAGSTYKGVMFIAALLGVVVYALFGDLTIFGSIDTFYDALFGFLSGESIPDGFWMVLGLFPFVSIGMYYASYKLSCKLYLKGVETYAK